MIQRGLVLLIWDRTKKKRVMLTMVIIMIIIIWIDLTAI